jgi:hypothetical protein
MTTFNPWDVSCLPEIASGVDVDIDVDEQCLFSAA